MEFKEFLKKLQFKINQHKGSEVIYAKDLGNWAWGSWLEMYEACENKEVDWENELSIFNWDMYRDEGWDCFVGDSFGIPFFQIAVDCLGKKEIKKRLKELTK